ncbi:MAG: helicase-exonuclease AddAB subunit AddA [Sedimentisphaerales bacterium]|nr:helicase-exonuclease AddAB subunit AddA [Sedimentisphaerales bacterium]
MAGEGMKWTEQQLRAVKERGSDILVTASAGTGKTAVLSGRCADIVSDSSVCPDVLSVLVLTFTDAAAEQMRFRIGGQIQQALLKTKAEHLRHQLVLLAGADISTVHSFCKRLITEHFYKLGLDPTFRVIDADEQKLLKTETLEATIEWAWQQSNLRQALAELLGRRELHTSGGFLTKIIEASNFLDSVVSRQRWYERATKLTEVLNPLAGGAGAKQKEIVGGKLHDILNQLRHVRRIYEKENPNGKWFCELEEKFVAPVTECTQLYKAGSWDEFVEKIKKYQKPSVYKPKQMTEISANIIQQLIKKAVSSFGALSELTIFNPEYLDAIGRSVTSQTKVFIELVKKFDQLYSQAKSKVNCLDFANLEHYALKLLTEQDSSGENLSPSETARVLRRRYRYVFIDEYQDINAVQKAIIDMLSNSRNLFVVGDVKQSIYAWRGAQPQIFLDRLKQTSVTSGNMFCGTRVDLNTNFRSVKGILDFVNALFGRLMSSSFCKIDYDDSAKLRPHYDAQREDAVKKLSGPIVELHILNDGNRKSGEEVFESAGDSSENLLSSRQRQAAMIAQRIRKMVGVDGGKSEFDIWDEQLDKFRTVEYRDIVVLMRSLAGKADFIEVLRLAGIPISCESTAGYFEATEINDIISLLKVLDNPQRDIELAAVLRGPLFRISDTELAKIKLGRGTNRKGKSFYNSVVTYCFEQSKTALVEKLKKVLEQIEQWRTLARRGELAEVIWHIYQRSNLLAQVSALPNGQVRRANLRKLHDRAIQFEGFASSYEGVSLDRFVAFIEKLQELGGDWAPAEPETSIGNAVRVMSVHKSKGLEFPVVFIAELERKFNKTDVYQQCLIGSDGLFGLQIIDRRSKSRLNSLAHQVISQEKLAERLAEEMRILYVAATRAKDRLILTASQKKQSCRDIVASGYFLADESVPAWQLRACNNHLDWILYGLSNNVNLHKALETGLMLQQGSDELFSIRLYEQAELRSLSNFIIGLKKSRQNSSDVVQKKQKVKQASRKPMLSQVKGSLKWQYELRDALSIPAKQSVTRLTHINDEFARSDYRGMLNRRTFAADLAQEELPAIQKAQLIGTATHLVISQLDLVSDLTIEAIESKKRELVHNGAIAESIAGFLDVSSIMSFFESNLGQLVLDKKSRVLREWPFTFALPTYQFSDMSGESPVTSDEVIVVQGIIDMLLLSPDGLTVIDFKTNRITAEQAAQTSEGYRRQLQLYSMAAQKILKSRLCSSWLYFLTPGCAVEI